MDSDNNDSSEPKGSTNEKLTMMIYCYNDFLLITEYCGEIELSTKIIYRDTILNESKVREYYII